MQGKFKAYQNLLCDQKINKTQILQAKSKYSSYLKDIEGCDRWLTEYKDNVNNSIMKYQSFIDKVNRTGRKM